MRAIKLRLVSNTLAVAAVVAIANLTVVPLNASASATSESASFSRGELKQLIRDAHTPEEYRAIASYYRSKEVTFRNKAAAAQAEWDRRQAVGAGAGRKFPASADSARSLYEYYTDEANEMAERAASYEERAR